MVEDRPTATVRLFTIWVFRPFHPKPRRRMLDPAAPTEGLR